MRNEQRRSATGLGLTSWFVEYEPHVQADHGREAKQQPARQHTPDQLTCVTHSTIGPLRGSVCVVAEISRDVVIPSGVSMAACHR